VKKSWAEGSGGFTPPYRQRLHNRDGGINPPLRFFHSFAASPLPLQVQIETLRSAFFAFPLISLDNPLGL